MKIQELMTPEPASCLPYDNLNAPAEIMWERDCGIVPVVDEFNEVLGVVTDRDICMAAYTQGKPLGGILVESCIAHKVVTCRSDDPIEFAEQLMRDKGVRRLPVIDGLDHLVGIISLNDIALAVVHDKPLTLKKVIDEKHVAETLAAICEHQAAHVEPELLATAAR